MNEKTYFFIIIFVFLFQIVFSFFYSSQMVNQNNLLNQNLKKIKILEQENRILKIKSSNLYSINNIYSQLSSSSATPIKNIIDIREQN